MVAKRVVSIFFSLPLILLGDQAIEDTSLRGPDNKTFDRVRVNQTLQARDLFAQNEMTVVKNLTFNGSIAGNNIIPPSGSSTPNAIAQFTNTTSSPITSSPLSIDSAGNLPGVNTLTATLITADLNGTASAAATVGGQSATDSAYATVLALSATSDPTPNTLVKRDHAGSFVTTTFTITGAVTEPTDVATKEYVDAMATANLLPKTPANAVSSSNISSLSGPQTIDGVSLIVNDRVLLVAQTNPIENGLWEIQPGAWTRPTDFTSPPHAGKVYVVALNGTTLGGTSWLCTSPLANIDTDPLSFTLYTPPGATTTTNVGTGTGDFFKDKLGNYLHIKSLISGPLMLIDNNSNDITLSVTARSAAIPTTIALRDTFGNFAATTLTAALTGTASDNVLRRGDTMTGILTLASGTASNPSAQFKGSTTTGFSATPPQRLSLSTNGIERMSIDGAGTIAIDQFVTEGVLHNNASGNLSSSFLINNDIGDTATIDDSKLATISLPGTILDFATSATSLNVPDTISRRDDAGNFTAHIITAAAIVAPLTDYIERNGDAMTGTFTVASGTTTHPSVQFVGSQNTGISAATPNKLSFDTNGTEQLNIDTTGIVSLPGKLALAPGSTGSPSLLFSNGTNTGLSSATPNKISFDVNGIERMSIDATGIHSPGSAFAIGNVMSMLSTQSLNVTTMSTFPVTINNTTSLLIISYITGVPITIDITFPTNPHEGQLVTIKAILTGASNNLNLTYSPAFNPTSEGITLLNPTLALNTTTGGAAVTYIYHSAGSGFPNNGWYRYGRG